MKRMINFCLLLAFLIYPFCLNAQKERAVTTYAPNGRFEILQSELARKYTIKIDKYTGDTWQMVLNYSGDITWEKIYREEAYGDIKKEDRINYQLFFSGFTSQDIFLINVNTGTTWQLVKDSKKGAWWTYRP